MRSLDELTMYANGLLEPSEEADLKRHMAECASCKEVLTRLRAERRLLLRAADREAPAPPAPPTARFLATLSQAKAGRARPRLTLVGSLAAAVMLSALAWLLWRGPAAPVVNPAATEMLPQSTEETLNRLIAALKSPHPEQRDIASAGLRRFGAIAAERLEKSGTDRRLIDDCLGITPQDRELLDKIDRIKITVDFTDRPLIEAIDRVREASGLTFHFLSPELTQFPEQIRITMKHSDYPVSSVLKDLHKALQPFSREKLRPAFVKDGVVTIGAKEAQPDSYAPIRPPAVPEVARARVAVLVKNDPGERDRAAADLRRLGFAAEPALWDGFRSPNPELRARVADLLRGLYLDQKAPPAAPPPGPLDQRLALDAESVPTLDILRRIVEPCGLALVFECGPDEKNQLVTFKVQQLTARNCLKLLLPHRGLDFVELGNLLYVFPSNRVRTLQRTPLWAPLEEAREIEKLVEDVASGVDIDAAFKGAKLQADNPLILDALFQAAEALPGDAGIRCRAALRRITDGHRVWAINLSSGAELQAHSPAQRGVLATKVTLLGTDTLRNHLAGMKKIVDVRADSDAKTALSLKDVPLETVLKVLTRPHGLDFCFDGPTLVIDKAERIHALVEKK